MAPRKPTRLWPGKAPAKEIQSSSSEGEDEDAHVDRESSADQSVQPELLEIGGDSDRRARIRAEALARENEEMAIESEEEEDFQSQTQISTFKDKDEEFNKTLSTTQKEESNESESEESSEEESESEQEVLLKPVFIPKQHRDTIMTKEKLEKRAEEERAKKEQQRVEKQQQSHQMASEEIKKELIQDIVESTIPDVDDTDGLNEQEEYDSWKLRELIRIKRDKEEQTKRDEEILDIERRRNMTDEQIAAENELLNPQKEKEKIKFLQKYYHKGAFYADEEILQRDYNEATEQDNINKAALPEIMQVKNFGLHGRTKWTHLTKEDTSKRDSAWAQNSDINKRLLSKMGGIKSSFDPPTKKSRTD